MRRIILLAVLLFMGVGCYAQSGVASAQKFPMISIPETITEPAERAKYLGEHYWDNVDFATITESALEEGVVELITLFPLYDEAALKDEAARHLKSYEDALSEARFQAASAESLHLYAKDIFEIWQNSGVFARRRALKDLRKRAGFKLESHRIGNYVAKTYDLMEAARRDFQKAQQECYAANVSYKIKPGIYSAIAENLKKL